MLEPCADCPFRQAMFGSDIDELLAYARDPLFPCHHTRELVGELLLGTKHSTACRGAEYFREHSRRLPAYDAEKAAAARASFRSKNWSQP